MSEMVGGGLDVHALARARGCVFALVILNRVPGRMPEWPKGAVCKIAGVAYGGSNPPPPTYVPTD
jgi:hypothetical protein